MSKAMTSPVRCNHCHKVYDLANVKVTARFSDATCYVTPCCERNVDDRTWFGSPAFTRLDDEAANDRMRADGYML